MKKYPEFNLFIVLKGGRSLTLYFDCLDYDAAVDFMRMTYRTMHDVNAIQLWQGKKLLKVYA